jgi:hypothetical protein
MVTSQLDPAAAGSDVQQCSDRDVVVPYALFLERRERLRRLTAELVLKEPRRKTDVGAAPPLNSSGRRSPGTRSRSDRASVPPPDL